MSDLLTSFLSKTKPKTTKSKGTTNPIQPKLTKRAEADLHGLSVGMFGFNPQAGDQAEKKGSGWLG